MKKTYSESELKTLAKGVLEQFPDATEVYATSDGNVFLIENRANLHAGKDGKIYPFKREISDAKEVKTTTGTKAPVKAKTAAKATAETKAPAKAKTAEKSTSETKEATKATTETKESVEENATKPQE